SSRSAPSPSPERSSRSRPSPCSLTMPSNSLLLADEWNAAITWLEEPLQTSTEGPLAGRTLLVKDLIDTAGIRTTYGSPLYGEHVPEQHATAVQRLLDPAA